MESHTDFGILFKNNSQSAQSGVSYSFKVTDASGKVITDVNDQSAPDGTGKQTGIKFTKAGPAEVLVSVDAVQGQPTGEFVENAKFDVVAGG